MLPTHDSEANSSNLELDILMAHLVETCLRDPVLQFVEVLKATSPRTPHTPTSRCCLPCVVRTVDFATRYLQKGKRVRKAAGSNSVENCCSSRRRIRKRYNKQTNEFEYANLRCSCSHLNGKEEAFCAERGRLEEA
eukprot:4546885-Amphidinium_carterae.1